jgi:3D (Asp-Asp-Asp) domain-containing protein
MKTVTHINSPKGSEDYSKIFNFLSCLTVIGIIFIAFSIPALAESPEEELPNSMVYNSPEVSITTPDTSYAFECKANKEQAKSQIDKVVEIFATIDTVEPDTITLEYVGEFYITCYAATIEQCGSTSGITASGRKCTEDPTCHTVAVDSSVIPLGSYLIIDGYPGIVFRADDTGSAIQNYDIDIYSDSEAYSKQFNNQSNVKVWIIKE